MWQRSFVWMQTLSHPVCVSVKQVLNIFVNKSQACIRKEQILFFTDLLVRHYNDAKNSVFNESLTKDWFVKLDQLLCHSIKLMSSFTAISRVVMTNYQPIQFSSLPKHECLVSHHHVNLELLSASLHGFTFQSSKSLCNSLIYKVLPFVLYCTTTSYNWFSKTFHM